jgi:DNA-binding NarL/FixJ family response regulator
MKEMIPQKKKEKKIDVWIVDDNKSYCMLLAESLNLSRKVRCPKYFHSVRTVLAALEKKNPMPQVILLDIKMPGTSGIEGIRLLRESVPEAHIIMLTSYDDEKEIKQSLEFGAAGYLTKNSSPEDVIRAVEKAIAGGSPLDPMITKKILSLLLTTKSNMSQAYRLTKREMQIINFIAKGFSSEKIAKDLFISRFTIDTHLKHIYHKLDVHSRHTLVSKAYDDGLIQ